MAPRNLFYAQSGGVTAVINATAAAVIETARRHPEAIGKVLAGRNGILGALREELYEASALADGDLAALAHTPGGAFGSCRYKLGEPGSDPRYQRLLEVFRAHDIGYFLYNGGNDSADTCLKVARLARECGWPLVAVHIPKTVDNDLPATDCCPGFGSVAKYVAVSTREAAFDVASMAETSTRVFILEVMGRHAGWIAAATGLAAAEPGDAPHLILFPEVPFDEARFLARVEAVVGERGYCVVVAAEGTSRGDGSPLVASARVDAFGHRQLGGVAPTLAALVEARLNLKVHWAVADYLQRSARHLASATDLELAQAVGRAAVEYALAGHGGVMVAVERLADRPYRWSLGAVPLEEVANRERKLPAEFIAADGFGITAAARAYLAPLVAGEAPPPYRDGLPDYRRLSPPLAERRLAPWRDA
ncbi:MAG: pyrophosphate--fructose 6-phosphate 1-phosphotransferase [Porticoccaceae bacterium]|nr:MAG: pyrophosphate--fructose 6-phosphate 1-phosphotransferase [Porticoccaceae bacterium]